MAGFLTDNPPDFLSPMVVKELRQGMRSRSFATVFLAAQMLFALMVLMDLNDGNGAPHRLWTLLVLAAYFIFPLLGMGALAAEMNGNTLELVLLTRLSPLQIAAGKWLTLAAQSGLTALTVLPYLAIFYFRGGVDIAQLLLSLLAIVCFSATGIAVAVGLSAVRSVGRRILVAVGFLFGSWFVGGIGMALLASICDVAHRGPPVPHPGWFLPIAAAVLANIGIALWFLRWGSNRLIPLENRVAPDRVYALASFLFLAGVFTAIASIFRGALYAVPGMLLFAGLACRRLEVAGPVWLARIPLVNRLPAQRRGGGALAALCALLCAVIVAVNHAPATALLATSSFAFFILTLGLLPWGTDDDPEANCTVVQFMLLLIAPMFWAVLNQLTTLDMQPLLALIPPLALITVLTTDTLPWDWTACCGLSTALYGFLALLAWRRRAARRNQHAVA